MQERGGGGRPVRLFCVQAFHDNLRFVAAYDWYFENRTAAVLSGQRFRFVIILCFVAGGMAPPFEGQTPATTQQRLLQMTLTFSKLKFPRAVTHSEVDRSKTAVKATPAWCRAC